MSDIREHGTYDIASRLLHMAQMRALKTEERHDYLPSSSAEAEKFVPHRWVLDAVDRAYAAGHLAGQEEARERMRHAMGAAKW